MSPGVNGTDIPKSELIRRADAIRTQLQPTDIGADFYHRVLDEMVSSELLYQSVQTKGLLPAETEVDGQFAAQSQRFGGEEAFVAALVQQGLSVEEVKAELRKEMGIQKLIERDLVPTVRVSEEEKRAFYAENQEAMKQPMQFRAAHILISADESASEEEKAEAKTKAGAIRSMVEAGQDFGELAAKNSGDPSSKDNGGELPWMSEGQTVPPFEAAMKSLEVGELSGVVETEYGYHIIRLLERKGAGVAPTKKWRRASRTISSG